GARVRPSTPGGQPTKKQRRPQSATDPAPFHHRLQVIVVQKPPLSRSGRGRCGIEGREHRTKCSGPEAEKANSRERSQRHRCGKPARIGRKILGKLAPTFNRLLEVTDVSDRKKREQNGRGA